MNRTARTLAVVSFLALTSGWVSYLSTATSAHVRTKHPRKVLACAFVETEAHCAYIAVADRA